jgi:hypothetical protein
LIISGPFKNLIQKHPINIELELGGKNKRLKNFSGVLILLLLLLSLWQYSSSGVRAENNAAITKSIIWTIYAVGEAGAARRPRWCG